MKHFLSKNKIDSFKFYFKKSHAFQVLLSIRKCNIKAIAKILENEDTP